MDESELKDYAEKTLTEGYTEEELRGLLLDEGHREEKINAVLKRIDDDKFARRIETDLPGIDLDGDRYIVEGSFKGEVELQDPDGNMVLRTSEGDRDLTIFEDTEGKEVFRIDQGSEEDIQVDMMLREGETKEPFLGMDETRLVSRKVWTLKSPDGDTVGEIKYENGLLGTLGEMNLLSRTVPRKGSVESADEVEIAIMENESVMKNRYRIEFTGSGDLGKETVIAALLASEAF